MEDQKIWWCDTASNLASKSGVKMFGDEVTGLISKSRIEYFAKLGMISNEQPELKEEVKQSEVDQLRRTVGNQDAEIELLKGQIKKTPKTTGSATKKVKDLESETGELKNQISVLVSQLEESAEAVKKVEDLENQIEDLTAPKKKGGKK